MEVMFPIEDGEYDGNHSAVVFPVIVDGHRVAASVPASVLAAHFHAASEREHELLRAFSAGRYIIEEVLRDVLPRESGESFTLAPEHFGPA